MNIKYKAFPRLMRSDVLLEIEKKVLISYKDLAFKSTNLDLSHYHFSPVIGDKISEKELYSLRENVIDILINIGFPNKPNQEKLKSFDYELTKYLFENVKLSPNEASKNEIWNFFTCELMPDVVKWRFFSEDKIYSKDALVDRFLGGARNTLQRLWWRGYMFKNLTEKSEYDFLDSLNSDDMAEFEERRSIYGIKKLVRSMAFNYIQLKNHKNKINTPSKDILRDANKRLLRQLPWLSFESLEEDEIQNHTIGLFNQCLSNFKEVSIETNINQFEKTLQNNKPENNQLKMKKKILDLVSKKLNNKFIIQNPNFLTIKSVDEKVFIALYISKRYPRTNQKYWYSITTKHIEFLEKNKNSHIVLGMEDKDYCFILTHKWFQERKDLFNRSLTNYGSKTHIYIEDETGENYIVRSKDNEYPLESIQEFIYPPLQNEDMNNQSIITEAELIDPAIQIIKDYGKNGISTSDLIKELRLILKPSGEDTKQLKGRSDDKFSQKVRNLKSHRKLEKQFENISFINDKYYWVHNITNEFTDKKFEIPSSIEWRQDHIIRVVKEKLPISGGQKAINQWAILKNFNNKPILEFTDEASKQTYLRSNKHKFHSERNGMPWWEQELLYCVQKKIIKITNEKGKPFVLN